MGIWRDGGGGIKVRSDGGSDDGLRDVSLFSLDECECVCVCVCVCVCERERERARERERERESECKC